MGDIVPDVLQSSSCSYVVKAGTLPEFLDQWRNISSNRFVVNMVKGHHLQLRFALCYSIISGILVLRLLLLIIPLFRRRWMNWFLRVLLNHPLVDLVFTPTYLLFLSICVDYIPFSTLSSLISICTYLL